MIYTHYAKNRIDIRKSKLFVILFYSIFPLGVAAWLSAFIFYEYNFEKPSLWIAIFAAFIKNIWGILGAVMMLGFVGKVGGIIRKFFYAPIFTSLGRTTYCIYLVHTIAFRIFTGDISVRPSVSWETIVSIRII